MYKNVAQWIAIRKMVFEQGVSQRKASMDTGIHRVTIARFLKHKLPPQYYRQESIGPSKLGSYNDNLLEENIEVLLSRNYSLSYSPNLTTKCIFEKLRDEHGYKGSYWAVRKYMSRKRREGLWGMIGVDLIGQIRRAYFKQQRPIKEIVRLLSVSRTSVRKVIRGQEAEFRYEHFVQPVSKLGGWIEVLSEILEAETQLLRRVRRSTQRMFEELRGRGYDGAHDSVHRFVKTWLIEWSRVDPPAILDKGSMQIFRARQEPSGENWRPDKRFLERQAAQNWMHSLLQGLLSIEIIRGDVGLINGVEELLNHLYKGGLSRRNRAVCILADAHGIPKTTIQHFLGIQKITCRKYVEAYKTGGIEALYSRKRSSVRKAENEEIKALVFSTLHEPPSIHGVNRTTWKQDDLISVLTKKGTVVGRDVVRQITREAGFKWRKARIVLTSNDPDYREKLQHIQEVLQNLKADEAFFSIDEFGPFAVKMKGGRKLVGPAENFTVPQWQKSKGCLIMTAALELSRNQVTHFYSNKKNTDEMIKMVDILIKKYKGFHKLWLSWDAASWHISKKLGCHIKAVNVMAHITGSPIVDTAPLPAGAQFLNVIESVFSGLARGVIHNSDYKSVDEARAAIDRYFEERNENYQKFPQRAGKKIWGMEPTLASFSTANNCKDARY